MPKNLKLDTSCACVQWQELLLVSSEIYKEIFVSLICSDGFSFPPHTYCAGLEIYFLIETDTLNA